MDVARGSARLGFDRLPRERTRVRDFCAILVLLVEPRGTLCASRLTGWHYQEVWGT